MVIEGFWSIRTKWWRQQSRDMPKYILKIFKFKILFNPCMHRLRCTRKFILSLSHFNRSFHILKAAENVSIPWRRKISKPVTFTNDVLTGFKILSHTAGWNNFVAPFYCSGQLIHCCEISGNKNNLRLKSPKNSPACDVSW